MGVSRIEQQTQLRQRLRVLGGREPVPPDLQRGNGRWQEPPAPPPTNHARAQTPGATVRSRSLSTSAIPMPSTATLSSMIGVRPADGQGQDARRKRDQPRLAFTSTHALALIVLLVAGLAMSLTLLVQQAANLTQFAQPAISQSTQPNHDDGANDSGDSGNASSGAGVETEAENNGITSGEVAKQPDGVSSGGGETATGLIDLNAATSAELQTITGIGPVIAQRIIDHRTAIGRYESIEQLLDVTGIGTKTLEKIRGQVMVQ